MGVRRPAFHAKQPAAPACCLVPALWACPVSACARSALLTGFSHGCVRRFSGWPVRSGLYMRPNPFNLDEKPDLHAVFRGREKAGRHPSTKHQVDSPLHSERLDPLLQSACKRRFSSKSAASTPRIVFWGLPRASCPSERLPRAATRPRRSACRIPPWVRGAIIWLARSLRAVHAAQPLQSG